MRYANLDRKVTPSDSRVEDYFQDIDISKSNDLLIKENVDKRYWNAVESEGYTVGWYTVKPMTYTEGYKWQMYNPPMAGICGEIKLWAGTEDTIPPNYVPCDGRVLVRSVYEDLFSVIGTLYGNTTDTDFKIPDLRGRLIQGTDSNADVGKYEESSLPNLKCSYQLKEGHGCYAVCSHMDYTLHHSVYADNWSSGVNARDVSDHLSNNAWMSMDASRASTIYKNEFKKVQPPALVMTYIICIESL